jgi:hypothetical protein
MQEQQMMIEELKKQNEQMMYEMHEMKRKME